MPQAGGLFFLAFQKETKRKVFISAIVHLVINHRSRSGGEAPEYLHLSGGLPINLPGSFPLFLRLEPKGYDNLYCCLPQLAQYSGNHAFCCQLAPPEVF